MSDYTSRINRVLDYMEQHLDSSLTLDNLAREACFSPYHFHRIFYSFTGEKPFQFLQRLRLEKAANLLSTRPDKKIIDIALSCGFSNAPAFSRAFKELFSHSPSQWRKENTQHSNFSTVQSNLNQVNSLWIPYIEYHQGVQLWRMRREDQERRVEVKMLESMNLAYIRYTGPYKGDAQLFHRLWTELCTLAGAQGLIEPESKYLALYHDNPELTKDDKLRVTLAVSTHGDFTGSQSLGSMELPGGKYAFAHFMLNSREYQQAWDWVYREWLPQSGYFPHDRPAFELFPEDEGKSTDGRYPVIICVPLIAAP
ncbi:MAG: AraC family transcriptional regulator [Spirochaetaceae bacterium]|jgi:AraC family transcriptional regulator|nr:AraC family transcriptional regulator [Spirochaetaceae bacterium]